MPWCSMTYLLRRYAYKSLAQPTGEWHRRANHSCWGHPWWKNAWENTRLPTWSPKETSSESESLSVWAVEWQQGRPSCSKLREPLPRFIMGSQQKSISTKTRNKPGWDVDGMYVLNCYLNYNLIPFILLHPKNQPGISSHWWSGDPKQPLQKKHIQPLLWLQGYHGLPVIRRARRNHQQKILGGSHLPRF